MNRCSKCKKYLSDYEECFCKPFQVLYEPYYGDELETVYGCSYEDVVEKIAEEINIDEHIYDTDIFENCIEVTDLNGTKKSFNCVAIVDVYYSVRENLIEGMEE